MLYQTDVDEDDRVGGHGHVVVDGMRAHRLDDLGVARWYAVTVRFGSTIALYTRVSPMSMRMRCATARKSKASAMGLESMCTAYRRSAAS